MPSRLLREEIVEVSGIKDSPSLYIFSFENIDEAKKSLSIIKKYEFSKTCYIGRPNPSFTYLKK